MKKSLREVCEMLCVSRRAVQGYEKAGLVSASDSNERGYLLYNDEEQERIKKIKMYQEFGFTIKEIVKIIDAPKEELRSTLVQKLDMMQTRIVQLEENIDQICKLIGQL